jgi:hypothetical protein
LAPADLHSRSRRVFETVGAPIPHAPTCLRFDDNWHRACQTRNHTIPWQQTPSDDKGRMLQPAGQATIQK